MRISNSYEEVVVGKSYVSLIFAIVKKVREGSKNLVVDDPRFRLGGKWNAYIGEPEKKLLKAVGEHYGINCLEKIDRYAERTNTIIFLDEKMVELGSSPFSNIKELARKLPESFSEIFVKGMGDVDPERFDEQVDAFFESLTLRRLENRSIDPKALFSGGSEPFGSLFEKFLHGLNSDKLIVKQLRYVLQSLYQTILSNSLPEEQVRYLLTSVLSPRYRVDTDRLEDELTFAYKNMGGDTKETKIQEFKFYKSQIEYLLLESYEGVVKTDKVFLFGHFGKELPFEYDGGRNVYRCIHARCPLSHELLERFKEKRIVFSFSDRVGTDFPHWEIFVDETGSLSANYVYADYEGSKPGFYHKNASEDLFASLAALFPEISRSDWLSQVQFTEGADVWLDNPRTKRKGYRSNDDISTCLFDGRKAQGMSYCGPLRARSLGYFGYLTDILDL